MIKAIETRYKGYRFRSRLEARYAVFFDALGLEWEYEPEGYELSDGSWYLPDFKVRAKENDDWFWFEVKGAKATKKDLKKLEMLCKGTSMLGYISSGTMAPPTMKVKQGFAKCYEGAKIYCRRPNIKTESCSGDNDEAFSSFINNVEDNSICAFYEDGNGNISIDHVYVNDTEDAFNCTKTGMPIFIKNSDGEPVDISKPFRKNGQNLWVVAKVLENGRIIPSLNSGGGRFYRSKSLRVAYNKARSARFEHGEKG